MDNNIAKESRDTERLILDAAMKEFSTKGYDGARTSSIAAEAGVTHAMLHYYFRSKEKLFERIFKNKIKDIMEIVLNPILRSHGSLKERLRRGIESHFNLLMANETLPIFFVTTLNSRPSLYKDLIGELFTTSDMRIKALQGEFDKAFENGEIKQVNAIMLLADIAALNVFPFVATPVIMAMTGYSPERKTEFLEARRKENVETILKRIS